MRYGIFSDIHANLEALEAVVKAFQRDGVDSYFCVGDVVGYGANPHECIDIVKDLNVPCVAGNHDWAVIDRVDTRYFNPMAKMAVDWTRDSISPADKNFLENLKLVYKNEDFILVHATLHEALYFHYLTDEEEAKKMFELMDLDICFVGHTHIPWIFSEKKEKIVSPRDSKITLENGEKYIINVGSVGQPRDGNPMASYCIYDTKEKSISIKRVNYDVEAAQRKIVEVGLPPFLASRLAVGK